MAFSNVDCTWINGTPSYDETELRRADAALVAGAADTSDPLKVRGGVVRHASNSLAVTVNASDVVSLQPGAVAIPGDDTASGGVYRSAIGTVMTETLPARDATNTRIDLVVFEVIAGGSQARPRVIAGVASGAPVAPAKPARAVELARITVPNVGGGAASVDSTRRIFVSAPGGRLQVASAAALPAVGNLWERAVALDTGTEYEWDGTAWTDGTWSVWVPTYTNITPANAIVTARYRRIGKTIVANLTFFAGSSTTYAAGNLAFSLPVAARAGQTVLGSGNVTPTPSGSARRLVTVELSGSNAVMNYEGGTVTNTAPAAMGTTSSFRVQLMYEAA